MVNLDIWSLVKAAFVPIIYFGLCGFGVWLLWHFRGRQPGNTQYSVVIYSGIGILILAIVIGFFLFGIF